MTDSDKIKLADEILKEVTFDGVYCDCCYYLDEDDYCNILFTSDPLPFDQEALKYERCQKCIDLIGGIE